MKTNYFTRPGAKIHSAYNAYMIFHTAERRWYTLDKIDDRLATEFASAVFDTKDLEAATLDSGELGYIPKQRTVGNDKYVMLRLKQGLYVEINLSNND